LLHFFHFLYASG